MYPPLQTRRAAARGPQCPPFKSKDSVLQRPNDETARSTTVCPGLHRFADDYGVVWWEPGPGGGLKLGETPSFGMRREDLIVKDVPRSVIADGRTRCFAVGAEHRFADARAKPVRDDHNIGGRFLVQIVRMDNEEADALEVRRLLRRPHRPYDMP